MYEIRDTDQTQRDPNCLLRYLKCGNLTKVYVTTPICLVPVS